MATWVEDAVKRAFKDMDPMTGEFPAHWRCRGCGKVLNADGNHPAEIYAGTYTGLCYPCTGAGAFVVSVAELDGALEVSFPPHCPSWRRDRETFHAYPECEHCLGLGAKRAWRSNGSFWERCDACSQRYWHHPRRQWVGARQDGIARAAQARFDHVLDVEALADLGVKRAGKKKLADARQVVIDNPERIEGLRRPVMEAWAALEVRIRAQRDAIYATRPFVQPQEANA